MTGAGPKPKKGERFFLFYLFSRINLFLSVYGIQISSNNCLSWMSIHPHYFSLLPPEDILRLYYLFLRCADKVMEWKVTLFSSLLFFNLEKRRNIACYINSLHSVDHPLHCILSQFQNQFGMYLNKMIELLSLLDIILINSIGVLPILPLNSGIVYQSRLS